MVDFECVEAGGSVIRTVELVNTSTAEAFYQWDIDCSGNSVFSILPASGAVLPHSQTRVKAAYRPTQPNAHYRRVACLIQDGVRHVKHSMETQVFLPMCLHNVPFRSRCFLT